MGEAARRARRLPTSGATAGSRGAGTSTSVAVMTARARSRLTTTARSRPVMLHGHDSAGSSPRRSRAGSPVRRISWCFPTSSTRHAPAPDTAAHSAPGAAAPCLLRVNAAAAAMEWTHAHEYETTSTTRSCSRPARWGVLDRVLVLSCPAAVLASGEGGCWLLRLRPAATAILRDHARLLPPALVAWRHEHARRGAPDSAACGGAGGTKAAACGGGSEAARGAGDALWALLPRFALVIDVPMVWAAWSLRLSAAGLVDGKNRKCVAAAASYLERALLLCVLSGRCRQQKWLLSLFCRRQNFKNSKLCLCIR